MSNREAAAAITDEMQLVEREREAFNAWFSGAFPIGPGWNSSMRPTAFAAWKARARLSAPVAAQPAASGVDALWVETAMGLAHEYAVARQWASAEATAKYDALRAHLSTALTGAATKDAK